MSRKYFHCEKRSREYFCLWRLSKPQTLIFLQTPQILCMEEWTIFSKTICLLYAKNVNNCLFMESFHVFSQSMLKYKHSQYKHCAGAFRNTQKKYKTWCQYSTLMNMWLHYMVETHLIQELRFFLSKVRSCLMFLETLKRHFMNYDISFPTVCRFL